MVQSKRIRRGAAGWGKVFSVQSSSGLSVQEFCKREGINASLFSRWRSRLNGAIPGERSAPRAIADTAPFIDLGELRSGSPRLEVRLDLGGGVILSIARG